MNSKTIFDAYSDFQAANTKVNKSTLRSVIHRFLVKHWGGEAPKGGKATNEEVFKLVELLKKSSASLLVGSMDILEKEFVSQGIAKENSKSYKSAYKAFLKWVEIKDYFKKVEEENQKPDKPENIFTRNAHGNGRKAKKNYHNTTFKTPYALMAKDRTGKLIYSTDYINSNLENELRLFQEFRAKKYNCSDKTIEKDIAIIYRILGWLHRYKNVDLEDLSLSSIIKFIKLNVSRSDFKNKKGELNHQKYVNKKAMVREEAMELAKENRKLIEEYLDFLRGHPNSKLIIINTCLAIGKFVFRDEVDTDEDIDTTDLAIVKRLKELSKIYNEKAKYTPPSVPHSDKSVPWKQTFDILQLLRKRIHCLAHEYLKKETGKTEIRLRTKNAIISDLQRFLSLAFMILIPTDRSRTYYELEIGRTFVYGLYEADGNRFTPVDKLRDKSKAAWWIHLMPGDYKTSKTYNEYWGLMPNVKFDRDNDLYSYIDRWINEGREYGQKCNHNCFFRGIKNYETLTHEGWCLRIRQIFAQELDVPVTPKELRKMFITHLNNIGATSPELKGASHAMHHSQKMQESVYNSQTIMDRIAPIYKLNERMLKEFFDLSEEEEE
ncbi:hypothetical protein [Nostoc sp. DedQUE09]|uniref:hypothetical protein n=1 Tax=Nostoc sp. DedQUE09 TaxID=3075394 RepID=UPI002AD5AEC5|nr:hypothetical protein [Nostoc sp. DedQUE09]MDZ7955888.1 hypothetical protein [Nostoc sp. DedQUE09]